MILDDARTRQPLTVLGPSGPDGRTGPEVSTRAVARRLAELGIRPGAALRIQSRTSGGGAILAIGDDRIAVSREILAGIEVGPEVPTRG
jgi:Fe2+ transport system protein FeoA